jgi:hypothetical protein
MLFIPLTHLGIILRRIMLRVSQLQDEQVLIGKDTQARAVKEYEPDPQRQPLFNLDIALESSREVYQKTRMASWLLACPLNIGPQTDSAVQSLVVTMKRSQSNQTNKREGKLFQRLLTNKTRGSCSSATNLPAL